MPPRAFGCNKRKGRRYYLGRTEQEAKARYRKFEEKIKRGLEIPEIGAEDAGIGDLLTVKQLFDQFMTGQERRVRNWPNDRSVTTFDLVRTSWNLLARKCSSKTFHRPDHFAEYHADVSSRRNLVGVGNEVSRIKTVFKWAFNSNLEHPMDFGPEFRRPKKRDVKLHRHKSGGKLLAVKEFNAALDELGLLWRAAAYLGINCGYGNSDINHLRLSDIDFEKGLATAIRNKTGELRVATL